MAAQRPPAPRPGRRPPARAWTTPGASPQRARIELASKTILTRVATTPRWITFLALLAIAVGGALLPLPWGVLCLLVLVVVLAWLLYLAWPVLDPGARLPRLLAVVVVLGAAVVRTVAG